MFSSINACGVLWPQCVWALSAVVMANWRSAGRGGHTQGRFVHLTQGRQHRGCAEPVVRSYREGVEWRDQDQSLLGGRTRTQPLQTIPARDRRDYGHRPRYRHLYLGPVFLIPLSSNSPYNLRTSTEGSLAMWAHVQGRNAARLRRYQGCWPLHHRHRRHPHP